ncbi:hypothetical protein [uncultured Methanobrevibacter sp.]|nr:hypothetical protein [uncultured Methanobrevibacter sp.]
MNSSSLSVILPSAHARYESHENMSSASTDSTDLSPRFLMVGQ